MFHSPFMALFSSLFLQRNLVDTVTHENFSEKVLAHQGASVVLYNASDTKDLIYKKEIRKMMKLTRRAFAQSAWYFEEIPIPYLHFDLSDCVTSDSTSEMIQEHLLTQHGLKAFPTVVIYDAGISGDIHTREISRFETGVPEREYIDDFVAILNELIYKNLVEADSFYYAVDKNGTIVSHPRK